MVMVCVHSKMRAISRILMPRGIGASHIVHISTHSSDRPRASNPLKYRVPFKSQLWENDIEVVKSPSDGVTNQTEYSNEPGNNGNRIHRNKENACWIKIENISPLSSLEAILSSVNEALDEERDRGIVDLDAKRVARAGNSWPLIEKQGDDWVQKARLSLSTYGRPNAWFLKFENRSVVHALLARSRKSPLQCMWKKIILLPWRESDVPRSELLDRISDSTLRLEYCPTYATPLMIAKWFSKYDLAEQYKEACIEEWQGVCFNGAAVPKTFFVHFADASWARAAVREKQAIDYNGYHMRLVPCPKQIL